MKETLPPHFESAIFPGNPDPFFEEKKNGFLAALYDRNPFMAESIYERILKRAEQKSENLNETEEKYLRQIQVAFKRLSSFLFDGNSRGLQEKFRKLQSLIRKNVRTQSASPLRVDYNTWKKRVDLEAWQEKIVFATAMTFQMSSGCSNYCRRCNEWALPKIRSHFSQDALEKILEKLGAAENTDLSLYGASDPLDWEDSCVDLADILSGQTLPLNFSLLTKIPKGKEGLAKALWQMDIPLSVSLTDRNRSRIEALENQMNRSVTKQHASKDLLIPAGLDEDFISVKPSITDGYGTEITPEGVSIIIPTFTSALHPFGHKKLPVTRKTAFFPVKRLGRRALLVDYFKPLEVLGKSMTPFYLSQLLDVQVETLLLDNGSDALTPPGMRSLKEYFSIFEDIPRRQRQKMTRSVMARLKKDVLPLGGYKALSLEEKQVYREKLTAHLEFCDKSLVTESRRCALSFFLSAIFSFAARQPVKGRIISFLNRAETLSLEKKYGPAAARENGVSLFSLPKIPVWEIFRFYANSLVNGRQKETVETFIRSCPSEYDPLKDRFVKTIR
ncbi:MAG: hypothetical protein KKF12_03965 [Proteobacteria bacterium]|nr:hypothetical protein [Desulfobacula sp.]MBU3952854.1 hypothetical protein [Pseudomonadota bacterium]MBU4129953.1 hypothetical protein [Pseudomonadota bacterium]